MKLTAQSLKKLIRECLNDYINDDIIYEDKKRTGSGNPWHDTEGEWTDPAKDRGSYSYGGKKYKRKDASRKTSSTKTPCGRHPAKHICKSGKLKEMEEPEEEFEYPIQTDDDGEWYNRMDDKISGEVDADSKGWGDILSTVLNNYEQVDTPAVEGEIVCVRADAVNNILIGKKKAGENDKKLTRKKFNALVKEAVEDAKR